jgi:cysteine desulfurase
LYCASKCRITPLFFGGGQQRGLRPGTENTPLAVAFGLAAENSCASLQQNLQKAQILHNELISRLQHEKAVVINSPLENCSPYIVNFSIPGYRSETLLHFLEKYSIYVSSGSACSKGAKSHVLKALGFHDAVVDSALRISLCKYNTTEDLNALLNALTDAVFTLRSS